MIRKMRFKVGSKPTIRKDLVVGGIYGNCQFAQEMQEYEGDKVTITEVVTAQLQYKIKEDGASYFWNDKMFK
ncbi:MAG: hypothetical protein KAJ03_01770 [Gammaproteobacteria bacterium]|nr:hypothetical protein [Gammaproteobacteria bacterium]